MNHHRTLTVLTLLNLLLLTSFLLNQIRSVEAGSPAVLRGRGLEILDAQGKSGHLSRSCPLVLHAGRTGPW